MEKIMNRKSRQAAMKWLLLFGAIMFFSLLYVGKNLAYFLPKQDLGSVTSDQVKKGVYKAEVEALLPAFAKEEKGEYLSMPLADSSYMGVYVYNTYKNTFDPVAEDTMDYLRGNKEELNATPVKTIGYVVPMKEEPLQYMIDWFTDAAFFGLEDEELTKTCTVPYVYICIPEEQWFRISDYIFISIAACALLMVVWVLIFILGKGYQKDLRKKEKKYAITKKELYEDLQEGKLLYPIAFGKTYLVLCVKGKQYLYKMDDLLWVHQMVTTKKKNVQQRLFVLLKNGERFVLPCKKEQDALELLQYVEVKIPQVLIGYNEEWEAMAENNMEELLQLSAKQAKKERVSGAALYEEVINKQNGQKE